MSPPDFALKRPTLILCIFSLLVFTGIFIYKKIPVNIFPQADFPVVFVKTFYPGASPQQVENQISKPLENRLSVISGIRDLISISQNNLSSLVVIFDLDSMTGREALESVTDKLSGIKNELPDSAEQPVILAEDPSSQPVMLLALKGNSPPDQLYNYAKNVIIPELEEIEDVSFVQTLGQTEQEVAVDVDLQTLKEYELPSVAIVKAIKENGRNIPIGKRSEKNQELMYKMSADFRNLQQLHDVVVNFYGNGVPITVGDLASISLQQKPRKTFASINSEPTIILSIFKDSSSNTVELVKNLKKRITQLNQKIERVDYELEEVLNTAIFVKNSINDIVTAIILGIILTIIVVFFFLGDLRCALIVGLAIPVSILSAIAIIYFAGYSFNIMTLLALSLAVGLLIDDSIVVRENIMYHIQQGLAPPVAALVGTKQIMLAVLATTLTFIAVFGSTIFIGSSVLGVFLKEFGLSITAALIISFCDSLTLAPILCSHFFKTPTEKAKKSSVISRAFEKFIKGFHSGFEALKTGYESLLTKCLQHSFTVLILIAIVVFVCFLPIRLIPKTFLPEENFDIINLHLTLPMSTSLAGTEQIAHEIEHIIKKNPYVKDIACFSGGAGFALNEADFYINLVPESKRSFNATEVQEMIKKEIQDYNYASPRFIPMIYVGRPLRPFILDIQGRNFEDLIQFTHKVYDRLKNNPNLEDVEIEFLTTQKEHTLDVDYAKMKELGINTAFAGQELRTLIEGQYVGEFYKTNEQSIDVYLRLKNSERDLIQEFNDIYVPNTNASLIPIKAFSSLKEENINSEIHRINRERFLRISAAIAPKGKGLGGAIQDVTKLFSSELKLPPGIDYSYLGQALTFTIILPQLAIVAIVGCILVYLVLASLYESLLAPFIILIAVPLAAIGSIIGIFITGKSLNIVSMIGCTMLFGIAAKNSILLVDHFYELMEQGVERKEAIIKGAIRRFRPILMTTCALIFGMLPAAIGIGSSASLTQSLGIAVVGGAISSTLLTLFVIPLSFWYIDRFRNWIRSILGLPNKIRHQLPLK